MVTPSQRCAAARKGGKESGGSERRPRHGPVSRDTDASPLACRLYPGAPRAGPATWERPQGPTGPARAAGATWERRRSATELRRRGTAKSRNDELA
eukprot:gene21911-51105_t